MLREAAQEDYQYYKEHSARAFGLLELMSGHRPVADVWEEQYYPEEYKGSTVSSVTEGSHSEYYYDYNRNDPDRNNPFPDKVKKWVLPVEADGPSGEYFVMFPDDLMETANLEEGDTVEWVDQGDGSYLLKKVEKKMTHQEMLDAGYKMTADGFWLPPQDC